MTNDDAMKVLTKENVKESASTAKDDKCKYRIHNSLSFHRQFLAR